MPKGKNLNSQSGAGKKGSDMRDHRSLKPGSHDTPDWKSMNQTTEAVVPRGNYGSVGGKHTFGN